MKCCRKKTNWKFIDCSRDQIGKKIYMHFKFKCKECETIIKKRRRLWNKFTIYVCVICTVAVFLLLFLAGCTKGSEQECFERIEKNYNKVKNTAEYLERIEKLKK